MNLDSLFGSATMYRDSLTQYQELADDVFMYFVLFLGMGAIFSLAVASLFFFRRHAGWPAVPILVAVVALILGGIVGITHSTKQAERERIGTELVLPVNAFLTAYEDSNNVRVVPVDQDDDGFALIPGHRELVEAKSTDDLIRWITPIIDNPFTAQGPRVVLIDENGQRTNANVVITSKDELIIATPGGN